MFVWHYPPADWHPPIRHCFRSMGEPNEKSILKTGLENKNGVQLSLDAAG
jgi:hypothetical protein